LIVGFAPAGATDICARLMRQWLSERLGQQYVTENRPGAGSNIATEAVVRAPADGYTLLLVGPPAAFNATLYESLNFNFIRDIAPSPMPRPIPARSVWRQAVNGTTQHIFGELFNMMAGGPSFRSSFLSASNNGCRRTARR